MYLLQLHPLLASYQCWRVPELGAVAGALLDAERAARSAQAQATGRGSRGSAAA